jgi:hypothetical protein
MKWSRARTVRTGLTAALLLSMVSVSSLALGAPGKHRDRGRTSRERKR